MTEQAFINYNEVARSYDLARANQGIIPAGRYAGFDAIQLVSTGMTFLELEFLHTTSGFTSVTDINTTAANQAKVVTPEGVIIEYSVVDSFQVDFELTGQPRIDVIVIEHDWEAIAGGQSSVVYVIKGTPGATPVAPSLSNSTTQTKLGEIYIAANGDEIGDMTFTKSPTPLPGNEQTMAFLSLITALQDDKVPKVQPTLSVGTPFIGSPNTGSKSSEWDFPTNGTMCFKDERGEVTFSGRAQFVRTPSTFITSTSKILMFQLASGFIPNRPSSAALVFPAFNETTRAECYIEVATNGDVSFVPSTNTNIVNKIATNDWVNFSLRWWKV